MKQHREKILKEWVRIGYINITMLMLEIKASLVAGLLCLVYKPSNVVITGG